MAIQNDMTCESNLNDNGGGTECVLVRVMKFWGFPVNILVAPPRSNSSRTNARPCKVYLTTYQVPHKNYYGKPQATPRYPLELANRNGESSSTEVPSTVLVPVPLRSKTLSFPPPVSIVKNKINERKQQLESSRQKANLPP